MAKQSSKKFNIEKLEVIASSLKKLDDGKYRIQVGIFGDKDPRPKDKKSNGPTNAEIGFVHEMGSVERHIPRRSFLMDTFTNHGKELEQVLAPAVLTLFDKGRVDEYLKVAANAATVLVDKAFTTSGWGAWPINAYRTIMAKLRKKYKDVTRRRQLAAETMYEGAGHVMPLIDSGQLRQAISARVVKA